MEPFVSYSQNGEDVVLARAFRDQSDGIFVDVGAAHPIEDSVTYALYERGWRGVNIEPNALLYEDLERLRPGDRNLNVGVSDQPGQLLFWQAPPEAWGRSTFSDAAARQLEAEGFVMNAKPIEVTTLDAILAGLPQVDLLKVDVEGFETQVLAGAELSRHRPKVLVIEATDPGTSRRQRSDWEDLVASQGYEETLFDGLNAFYVHRSARHLVAALSVPANINDDYQPLRHREEMHSVERRLRWTRRLAARYVADRIRGEVAADAGDIDGDLLGEGLDELCEAGLADHPELGTRPDATIEELLAVEPAGAAGSGLSAEARARAARLVGRWGDVAVPLQPGRS